MPEPDVRFIPFSGSNQQAKKAKESALNSASVVYSDFGDQTAARAAEARAAEPASERKLSKRLLQFPQNVQTGRPTPSHYIIFDRIKLSPGKGSQDDKSITLKGKTKSSVAQIALYMPASVNVGYQSKYEDLEVGIGAELGASVASAIQNIAASKDGFSAAATEQVPRIKTDLGKAGGDAATALALDLIADVGGLAEVGQLKANKVVTDKMELFFKGINRREFQYEFTFIPTSAEESKAVNNIVNEFKLAMLPEYTSGIVTDAISDRTLTVPDLFDIKYMYLDENYKAKRNKYLNKITTCYLTDMSVKYGSDRYTAYRPDDIGAPPQNTSVSLSFQEVEIVTRERAAKGF